MRNEVKIMGLILAIVIAGAFIGSRYYRSSVQEVRKPTANTSTSAPSGQLVREDSPTMGPADAKVTLVEFYDPECESCASFAPVVKKIYSDYGGKVRLVMRYMPLHKNSITAANFLEAAGEQGKYWEAQDLLFKKQGEWGEKHGAPPDPNAPSINLLFDKYAKELGIDMDKARASINARKFDEKISRDRKDGQDLGVRKTPSFFVNGRELARFGEADLRSLIDEEMKK
ncbi:MAG: thioredoxin domain-containing protein [Acidobacteria bacterium]|nr:thioredoxin domain-containing protein [Acidobacteriota bacterium]MBK9528219.1 thioredoxin domain-containing protein [Acidobacteriota bacterium]